MALVKLNNNGVKNATAFGSITGLGSMVFIKKLTASSSGTLSFVDGASGVVLDDTYKEYFFTFNNMHPQTAESRFQFNISVDTGSNYNVAKTTTFFYARHYENGSGGQLSYRADDDLAQGTGFQNLTIGQNNNADDGTSGSLNLFNPSSTTFVKHFTSRVNMIASNPFTFDGYIAGYGNTTSAVDAVRFQMSSGNIDSGDICLYGIA